MKSAESNAQLAVLFRAIATGDDATRKRMLEQHTKMATMAFTDGATRQSAAENFIEEVGHYVYTGDTALHVAAAAYRSDIASDLTAKGANVAARNRRGAQPLHYAADGSPTD